MSVGGILKRHGWNYLDMYDIRLLTNKYVLVFRSYRSERNRRRQHQPQLLIPC
jgi:hypothetical protein